MTKYDFCVEAYTVEKTVEVAVNLNGNDGESTLRLEVLKDENSGKYSVRCYESMHFRLQPSYPQTNGEFATKEGDFEVWVPFSPSLPWIDRPTVKDALQQALSFLSERCN